MFTSPQPLNEILTKLDARTPIGSVLRSAEWEDVPVGLRDAAVFSAGVQSARYLGDLQKGIRSIVDRSRAVNERGQEHWAQDRANLLKELRQLGEEVGLDKPGGRKDGKIRESDIADPISIARLKLVINTQMEMAYGYGDYLTQQDPVILDEWPALELVRITPKDAPRDWVKRWREAGGLFFGGRMIALKTSRVWTRISRFGLPYPPFDYQSGMGVEDIGRDEAEELGLVKPGQELKPFLPKFEDALKASVKGLDSKTIGWLKSFFGDQITITGDEAAWAKPSAPPPSPDLPPPAPRPAPAPAPALDLTALETPPRKLSDLTQDIDALVAEYSPALQEWEAASQAQNKLAAGNYGTPAYQAAKEQSRAALLKLEAVREKARKAIEIPSQQRGTVRYTIKSETPQHFNEGVTIVQRFTHPSLMPEVGVEIMKGDRAFYIAKTVNIGRLTPATTIAHEITHGTEIQNPATLAASRAFLKSRRKPGEKTVKLRNLFPGNGYEPWEITIEDDFAPKGGHAYSGKIYSPGIGNTELRQTWIKALKTDPDGAFGILEATELLTMGIERLQRDPIAFALEDRDYFNFTLTTLQKLEP